MLQKEKEQVDLVLQINKKYFLRISTERGKRQSEFIFFTLTFAKFCSIINMVKKSNKVI